ncbi:phosphoglycerate mutase [Thalassotalea litorea]|uniref:Phosphoglycerate mutase n=1 Tax=Thalassotalea litorea TaxID=2020715 RepID=A0A5R9IGB6_9GAMM|nr:histidine phosphatase family protein [Thalassotalea litorea]TLU61604.1 phosphoglycerate mutase [Thalassotalea litorea]
MKTLHLLRHAKSSWDDPELTDLRRPLNQRGVNDCQLMAPVLMDVGCCFDSIYCSNATRAKQTLKRISEHQFEPGMSRMISAEKLADTLITEELYCFDWTKILAFCQALPQNLAQVTLVGHNPAFTELQNYLSVDPIDHLPTCSYVRLECSIHQWLDLSSGCARTQYVITPKMLKKGEGIQGYLQ